MKCRNCSQESDTPTRVCPFCGQYMGAEPAAVEPVDPALIEQMDRSWSSRLQPRKRASDKPRRKRRMRRSRLTRKDTYQGKRVNWVKVGIFTLALTLLLAVAAFVWLRLSSTGQLMMARMGREASADAYWALGMEYLDQGYISRAVETYLKAEEAEPERKDLGDKLLLLAEAYEAADQMDKAEETYTRIYTDFDEKNSTAYRQAISILLSQERVFEAVELMRLAYDKTGDEGFFNQRSQLVPLPPTASLPSGRHMYSKNVEFLSSQGYEIYYTAGDGPLPETGTLYTQPITLNEGTYNFRAVAVSSLLVSDEMSIRYTITLPTPMAPKANMASKTYERPIRVSLRIVDEEDRNVDLYYTIDGSKPTMDSPRYKGDPILLPGGRVLLRAIAVNRYGKISNEMIVEYKINAGFKKYFRAEDQFADFELLKTSREAFVSKMGAPSGTHEIEDDAVIGDVTQLIYPWGEARFFSGEDGEMLYHIDTGSAAMKGPRGSAVGMQIKEVTDKFRDMGQLPNERGSRGIYYDIAEGYARYTVESDDPLAGLLEYIYVGSPDGTTTLLNYQIQGGRVTRILLRFLVHRLSLVE